MDLGGIDGRDRKIKIRVDHLILSARDALYYEYCSIIQCSRINSTVLRPIPWLLRYAETPKNGILNSTHLGCGCHAVSVIEWILRRGLRQCANFVGIHLLPCLEICSSGPATSAALRKVMDEIYYFDPHAWDACAATPTASGVEWHILDAVWHDLSTTSWTEGHPASYW